MAAIAANRSITCRLTSNHQQQAHSIALYMSRHGKERVRHFHLSGDEHGKQSAVVNIHTFQLASLHFSYLRLHLRAADDIVASREEATLRLAQDQAANSPVKQLRLCGCRLYKRGEAWQ
jgi:hypothetical protein